MKPKIHEIIIIVAFCGFLGLMSLGYLLLPKTDFSQTEKRFLAKVPELTWDRVATGEFGADVETYMADHIPGRDFFVGLNAYVELLTGRQTADDILVTWDGRLVEAPVKWNPENVDKNMAKINAFAEKLGQKVDLLLVPSAGWASRNDIVGLADPYTDPAIIESVYKMAGKDVRPLDLTAQFDDPALYYRTDHHWTSGGAYKAYESYMKYLGRDYRNHDAFTVETVKGFRGSTHSRAALWLIPGENLELWTGSKGITVTNGESEEVHEGIFYRNRLEETDKYTVYLDGNHSMVRIKNPNNAGKGKLLVIRDSYSNCLGGFLAESYEEVVLVDLRYYRTALSQLCEKEGFTDILVCYSLSNFMTDTNVVWLR